MIFFKNQSHDADFWFAAEEYISEKYSEPVFMLWSTEPTVMLGNFQNSAAETDLEYIRASGIKLTRRRSGGGAIYTDRGAFQYTYWIPGKDHSQAGFAECSAPVLGALRDMGLSAEFSGRNDIMVDGFKVSGTARYITDKGIIHHGSLLFSTDKEAMANALTPDAEKMRSKGIASVGSRITNISDLLGGKMTADEFAHCIEAKNTDIRLFSEAELTAIYDIKARFDSWQWIFGGDPKAEKSKEKRFDGGRLSCSITTSHGIIDDISFEGDIFCQCDALSLKKALCGCRYDEKSILDSLKNVCIDPGSVFMGVNAREFLGVIL